MSDTAEKSQQPAQASHTGFDPIEFWYLHKTKIIAFVVVLVAALIGYAIFSSVQTRAVESANAAFAAAKTADDYKKVIAEHSGQVAAGNAQLKLAEILRNENKLDEANATLKTFIEKQPQHPMIAGAWLALAQNAESAGKTDEALTGYQKVLTTFPTSYAAPLSLLGQGRMEKAKGLKDNAKRTFEKVISDYHQSSFEREAQNELKSLK